MSYPADTYRQDFRVDYATANVTANIGSRLLLKAGLNVSPYTLDGFLPDRDGRRDIPDQEEWAPLGTEGDRETYYLTADWIVNDNFVISARGGFYRTNVVDTGIPFFDVIHNYSHLGSIPGYLDSYPEIPADAQQNPGWYSDNLQLLESTPRTSTSGRSPTSTRPGSSGRPEITRSSSATRPRRRTTM